jgi:hypothetical protein
MEQEYQMGHRRNRHFLREEAEVLGTTLVQMSLCSNLYLKKLQRNGSIQSRNR